MAFPGTMIAAYRLTHSLSPKVSGWPPGVALGSSNESGKLSQWPRHDDSIVNIVLSIISFAAT